MDEKLSLSPVLAVQARKADEGACLQEPQAMEGTAESAVEGGVEQDQEREETVRDPGPSGRRQVQQGSTGLPIYHGGRKAGPAPSGGRCTK